MAQTFEYHICSPNNQSLLISDVSKKDLKFYRPVFLLDEYRIKATAKRTLQQEHTISKRYVGLNNVTYYKKCIPPLSRICIHRIERTHVPFWNITLNALKTEYPLQLFDHLESPLNISSSILQKCGICGRLTNAKNSWLCNECGKIAHKGWWRFTDAYTCRDCGKTLCKDCVETVKKWLFFRRRYCLSCIAKHRQGIGKS